MARMVQIRNMPEQMHRKLKARAAEAGLSLSEYLLRELRGPAEQPTTAQILERLRQRERFEPRTKPADALRQERERR
jgi:antitoxin FitA